MPFKSESRLVSCDAFVPFRVRAKALLKTISNPLQGSI